MGRQKNVDLSIIPDDVKDKSAFEIKDQETKDKKDIERKKDVKVEKIKKPKKLSEAYAKRQASQSADLPAETRREKAETLREGGPKIKEEKKTEKKIKHRVKKVLTSKTGPVIQIRKKPLHGKNYRQAQKLIDKNTLYSVDEALKILPKTAKSKFTESVEVHLKLAPKKSKEKQSIRGTIKFPHPTGKKIRIAALCGKPEKAKKAGAEIAGSDDLIKQIKKGKIDFDILVAEPQMMAKIWPLAKILGPRGLMPNPKSGTISENIEATIKELAGGKIEYKTDDTGNIHVMTGKVKDDEKDLKENIQALIEAIGIGQIRNITICSTMGPGIKIDHESLEKDK